MHEKTIYLVSDLFQREKRVRLDRKKCFRELLTDIATLYINTGKPDKALAIVELIANLIGEKLAINEGIELVLDEHDEPAYKTADAVAMTKAVRAQQKIDGERALLFPTENAYMGSDVNAFTINDGVPRQQHKLERFNQKISWEKFVAVRQQLIQEYCHPLSGQVRIIWDLATHVINGKDHTFSDDIEVISAPIDQELLEIYLWDAWMNGSKNGLMMKSNLHFAAMECLIENGQICSIAILPEELKVQGYVYEDLRQGPTPSILAVALYSIITNKPPVLIGEVPII